MSSTRSDTCGNDACQTLTLLISSILIVVATCFCSMSGQSFESSSLCKMMIVVSKTFFTDQSVENDGFTVVPDIVHLDTNGYIQNEDIATTPIDTSFTNPPVNDGV